MLFPEWSDLGKASNVIKGSWQEMMARIEEYRCYYNGEVFTETVPEEGITDSEAPLLYPAGLNIIKMIAQAQADSLFGEYEEDIVTFEAAGEETTDSATQEAVKLLQGILRRSNGNAKLWEAALEREVYGGTPFKVTVERSWQPIRWSKIPLEGFFPVWDPDSEDVLLEVYVLTEMTRDQARIRYGYDGDKDLIQRVEHWTPGYYTNEVDGKRIDAYSGVNPWGFVPFVYIPRIRTDNWWGDPLTPDLIAPQNELNARIADVGEAINYNAHPTRWGINLPRAFKVENFPLGPNAFWDLGRSIGTMPEPQVGVLEVKNPVPAEVFTFINFLYDWTRVSSFLPPIAFGQDNGGGQRSGDTLEIRMWSMVKATQRSRSYFTNAIARLIWMTAQILKEKRYSHIPVRAISRMEDGLIVPRYGSVLPRDHQATVDEVVKLLATVPPSISLETAQKILGRGPGEVQKILEMLQTTEFYQNAMIKAAMQQKQAQDGAKEAQPGKKKAE